jgi:hypothetical protein
MPDAFGEHLVFALVDLHLELKRLRNELGEHSNALQPKDEGQARQEGPEPQAPGQADGQEKQQQEDPPVRLEAEQEYKIEQIIHDLDQVRWESVQAERLIWELPEALRPRDGFPTFAAQCDDHRRPWIDLLEASAGARADK